MRFALIFIALAVATPAIAGTIQSDGQTIVIGPNATWSNNDFCTAPDRPLSNDQGEISNYQAQRQKFMDCVRKEADGDRHVIQEDLDRSLAALQNDPLESLDEVHRDNRGAIDRLGASGYHK